MATTKTNTNAKATETPKAPKPETIKETAVKILKAAGGPMKQREIAKKVMEKNPNVLGPTPMNTISARLYVCAKKGDTFKLIERGTFDLIERPAKKPAKAATA